MTWVSIFLIHPDIPTRVGVAIVGDSPVVFSFDPVRLTMTGIRIPRDVSADVTRGYGTYPISSVWKLDNIDKRRGKVYMETLEETLGVSIRFYIEPRKNNGTSDMGQEIGNALSFPTFFGSLVDKNRSNIPPWLFFTISRAYQRMAPSDVIFFDLSDSSVFVTSMLADGSEGTMIDPGKLGILLGTHVEDTQIRKENLRITVYNSTESPGLAQKATRILERLGLHVSSIANRDDVHPSQCILQGSKSNLTSKTTKALQWLYGCTLEEDEDASQSDIMFILGTDFEKRFLPS
jgi:hypothetical protein